MVKEESSTICGQNSTIFVVTQLFEWNLEKECFQANEMYANDLSTIFFFNLNAFGRTFENGMAKFAKMIKLIKFKSNP
jgi:hypothetical protein